MKDTAAFLKSNAPWLGAGALLTFMSSFGQTYFISLFSGEIMGEFDLSHGEWGRIYALGTLASAAVMVWAGGLTDRFRTRQLGALVLAGLAAVTLAMAVNRSAGLLVVLIFGLRFFGQGMASHAAVVAMSRWFVATRGRALAVATLGFTIGEAVLPVLVVALLAVMDWRVLWVVAMLVSLAGIPVLRRLLRTERHPQSVAESSESTGMKDRHWTRYDMLRSPLFWLMVPMILGPSAFGTAFFFHQVHFAEIKGWTHLTLVSFFPAYTGMALVAMILSGFAIDRFGVTRLIPYFQIPLVAGFFIVGVTGSLGGLFVGLAFMALSNGANATLPNAFWSEYFGTRYIGAIKALASAFMVLGSAIGPGLTGALIDTGIGLEVQFAWVAVYFVISTLCMWAGVQRYRADLPLRR